MKFHILVSLCTVSTLCVSIIQAKPSKRSKPEEIRNKEFERMHFDDVDDDMDGETDEPLALPYYNEHPPISLQQLSDSPYHEAVDSKGPSDPKEISMARTYRSKRYKRDSRFIDFDSLTEEEFLKLLSIMRDYLKAEENIQKEKSYIPESLLEQFTPPYPMAHLPQSYRKKTEDQEYYIPNLEDSNEDMIEMPYSLSNFNQNRLKKRNYLVRDDIGYIPLPGQKRSFFSHRPGLSQPAKRRTLNEGEKIFALANMMAKNRPNTRSGPFFLPAAV